MENRVLDRWVRSLNENEIFVFGSNLAGRHGAGAAKLAMKWGAQYGNPEGIQGRTYAIPTKCSQVRNPLSLEQIKEKIGNFQYYAMHHPEYTFLVTEVGCGLSGYSPKDIAPLFRSCISIENIHFSKRFWEILKKS